MRTNNLFKINLSKNNELNMNRKDKIEKILPLPEKHVKRTIVMQKADPMPVHSQFILIAYNKFRLPEKGKRRETVISLINDE